MPTSVTDDDETVPAAAPPPSPVANAGAAVSPGDATVLSPVGQIPASTPGLPPQTDDTGTGSPGAATAAPNPEADKFIDQTIAAPAIGAAPTAAVPPAGTPGKPLTPDELEQRITQSTSDQIDANKKLGEAQAEAGEKVGQALQDKADLQRDQLVDEAAERQYVQDRQQALDKQDADNLDRAKNEVIPDFWQGREGQLVGSAITVGLSGFLSGALAGATGQAIPPNAVVQSITRNIDDYYARGKEKIDNLYKYAEQTGRLDDKMRARYAGELTDLIQQHAFTLQAASDRVQQVQAESQGKIDQARTNAVSAGLQDQANANLLKVQDLRKDIYDSATRREIADADMIRAKAAMAKVHRGAGGGGGAGMDIQGLAHALKVGAPDGKGGQRPLSYDEQVAAAKQFGVPIDAKAGRTSLKSVIAESAFDANQAAKEAKNAAGGTGGLQEQRLLSKEANDWRKQNHLDDLVKRQDELSAISDELKNAPHNALQQALAIEKAVSSARGGAASRQALDLALHHLGPQFTSLDDVKRAIVTKEIGQKQMDNFIGFLNNQLGTAQKEGKDKYDAFNNYIASQPANRQESLKAERGRLFSGLYGFGGRASAAPQAASGGGGTRRVVPTSGKYKGKTVTIDSSNNIVGVQ